MEDSFVVRKWKKPVRQKEDKSVVVSMRMEKEMREELDELVKKSGYSRNELMRMALRYALDHLEFVPDAEE